MKVKKIQNTGWSYVVLRIKVIQSTDRLISIMYQIDAQFLFEGTRVFPCNVFKPSTSCQKLQAVGNSGIHV